MINRLLNINELEKCNWIDYQDRFGLRRKVNDQVILVEIYINKPLDMTIEICALKKVLITDLMFVYRESKETKSLSDQQWLSRCEYEEYLITCNINYLFEVWIKSPASTWVSRK